MEIEPSARGDGKERGEEEEEEAEEKGEGDERTEGNTPCVNATDAREGAGAYAKNEACMGKPTYR